MRCNTDRYPSRQFDFRSKNPILPKTSVVFLVLCATPKQTKDGLRGDISKTFGYFYL